MSTAYEMMERIKELEGERDELLVALGDIRGLFKMPEVNAPLEPHWIDAMSDPLSVKAYVEASIRALEAERDALRKDAERYRFIKDDRIVLAGGPWPVAPFGEECDRKIDAAIAAKEPK